MWAAPTTAINTEVYNVSDFLNFKEEVVKQFLGHISDEKVIEYIRAEPRQAILDIFRDVFFNIKKKRNMVLAVKDLDPLTVCLHQNRGLAAAGGPGRARGADVPW